MMLLERTLFGVMQCVYVVQGSKNKFWMSRFRKAWQSLNFYKEYLFGYETLIFATLQILHMHKQLVTLQRQRET